MTELTRLRERVAELEAAASRHEDTENALRMAETRYRRLFQAVRKRMSCASTERKRMEARSQLQVSALNAAANAILITDERGTIEWANPAFAELTGYTVAEAIGKHSRDLINSGHHDRAFFKSLWDTIMSGQVWRGEITNRRKDGTLYTEEQSITPVRNAQGEICHFIAVKQDITDRRRLEAQYHQAQKMEAVGRLAGGVAHDFNNLLTVILGYCELSMVDLEPDDQRYADIADIHRAGTRAAGLTRQLLVFSRKQPIAPTLLDLGVVVADMQGMLARLIGEDIRVVVGHKPGLALVKADRGQLEQVILNLAVNARDAMARGGTLTIDTANVEIDEQDATARNPESPGPFVVLTVTDTGSGMTPEVQAHLFEPFFTTKDPGKGTGLGMANVHSIVTRSGGSIAVSSEVGRGTSFRMYFPQAVVGDTVVELPPPASLPQALGQTVLVVDDEAGLVVLARRLLERQGYTVLAAANAEEALALFERTACVDVILTDVVMPGASGPELVTQLLERWPTLKVIYMSGYSEEAVARHGGLGSGVPFLHKPFTSETLGRKIQDVLAG